MGEAEILLSIQWMYVGKTFLKRLPYPFPSPPSTYSLSSFFDFEPQTVVITYFSAFSAITSLFSEYRNRKCWDLRPCKAPNQARLRRTFKKHSRPQGDVSELAQESRESVQRERFRVSQSCFAWSTPAPCLSAKTERLYENVFL